MFGFAGNVSPLHKMHFFPGGAYCGLCCFVYMFSEGYQLELGQKALEENIIVYLGTGETKHTAVLLKCGHLLCFLNGNPKFICQELFSVYHLIFFF